MEKTIPVQVSTNSFSINIPGDTPKISAMKKILTKQTDLIFAANYIYINYQTTAPSYCIF